MNLAAPGESSGRAFFSALNSYRMKVLAVLERGSDPNTRSLRRDFSEPDCSPDLHGLLSTIKFVRRRILTSTFLGGSVSLSKWILVGLIVAGVLSAKWTGWIVFGALFAVVGVIAVLVWTVRTRLSVYEAAYHLDS